MGCLVIDQIRDKNWKEISELDIRCILPFTLDEFEVRFHLSFDCYEEAGLGTCHFCVMWVDFTPYLLRAYPQGPKAAQYISVAAQISEENWDLALSKLLATVGIERKELVWEQTEPNSSKWVLYRFDDNDNEVEMFRYADKLRAEWAQMKFEAKSHKQTYFISESISPQFYPDKI